MDKKMAFKLGEAIARQAAHRLPGFVKVEKPKEANDEKPQQQEAEKPV